MGRTPEGPTEDEASRGQGKPGGQDPGARVWMEAGREPRMGNGVHQAKVGGLRGQGVAA